MYDIRVRLVYSSLESKRLSWLKYGNDSGLSPYFGDLVFSEARV